MFKPLKLWALSGHRSFTSSGSCSWFHSGRKYWGWKSFSELQASGILPEQQPRAKLFVRIIQEYEFNSLVSVISLMLIIRNDWQKYSNEYICELHRLAPFNCFSSLFFEERVKFEKSLVQCKVFTTVFSQNVHSYHSQYKSGSFVSDTYSPSLDLKRNDDLMWTHLFHVSVSSVLSSIRNIGLDQSNTLITHSCFSGPYI